MHDLARRAITLPPQLALDAHVLAADGAQALYERRMRVQLSVLEARHEAVAALAHAADLRAVERQIKVVLVRLRDACSTA